MITLYDYWRSSASYRVRIALELMGEPWEAVSVNLLDGSHKAPEHLARNPQGTVPAIKVDGLIMTQSLAIIEYLDTTRGLGFLPADPVDKARVQAMAHAIAMEIHPVCNLAVAKYASETSGGPITMESWMQRFIGPGLQALEAMVEGPDYCAGGQLSLVDLCLVPQLYNARRWNVDLNEMPKLVAIDARLAGMDAFAAAHPDRFAPE